MAEIKVKARVRKTTGKGAAKRLRDTGKVPGIVYAKGVPAQPVELDAKEVRFLTHGAHAGSLESVIVSLEIQDGDETRPCSALIKEIQHDPIKGNVLHIDFHQVSLTERIYARIPVVTVGDCLGVSAGGILEHGLRELEVSCMAMDLPEEAKVDISNLQMGQAIHVRDIDLGPKVAILTDPDLSVASVSVPRVVVEAVAVTEEEKEIAEPEVITEKKAEEQEEEEGPKEKKGE